LTQFREWRLHSRLGVSSRTFTDNIRVGDQLRRETEFTDIQLRDGGTGTLIVTTQTRRIYTPRGLALTEAANTVFREQVKAAAKSGVPVRDMAPVDVPWRRTITPSSVMLFRYSAITFNPHRIHYDRPYCMEVEGYPGLVVHGPFAQQCLLDLLRDSIPGRKIKTFTVRACAPLFDTAPIAVIGRPTPDGNGAELWIVTPKGTVAAQAAATAYASLKASFHISCRGKWPASASIVAVSAAGRPTYRVSPEA
jgi:3-methylfumaryl-CoA hydratase